tara:strand:- start:1546 stop:2625 length:1080 start_codon:yes stop_codon:yes gene_type:complete
MKKTIVHIIGGRPQFIKSLITIKAINHFKFYNLIINTGQHYDFNMSKIFLKIYPTNYKIINIKLKNINNSQRLSEMILKIDKKMKSIVPSLVIVYGDTDSTLAGVLFSIKKKYKTMHIEAGLRSYDLSMPEEQNRIVADRLSNYLISPTINSKNNLIRENINKENIFNFGDVMFDNINYIKSKIKKSQINNFLKSKSLIPSNYIYFTVHRESNSNEVFLKKIMEQLGRLENKIIWPMHPKFTYLLKKLKLPKNLHIIKPLNFDDNIIAIGNCYFVITDSGGVQKESFFLNKKVLLLRNETEWKELIKSNCVKICNDKIPQNFVIKKFINKKLKKNSTKLFGNGKSTLKIARLINNIVRK